MDDYDMLVIGSGPSGRRAAVQSPSSASRCWWSRRAAASAASRSIPAPSRRRRCARPCSTSPAGASAASTAAPTGSSRTSRAGDLIARLHKTLDHEVEVLRAPVHAQRASRPSRGDGAFPRSATSRAHHRQRRRPATSASPTCADRGRHAAATGRDYVPFDGKTRLRQRRDRSSSPQLPRSLTVIGAGVIGVEYATDLLARSTCR